MQLRVTEYLAVFAAVGMLACAPGGADGDDDDDNGNGADGGGADCVDARPSSNADGAMFTDAAACASTAVAADEALAPVDIIWVVDSSGSMDDEADAVQSALNEFSAFIAASGIDYRVILIGDAGDMTVPPPLGGSAEFLHVNRGVGSTNAFEHIVDGFSAYQAFRRPDALVHIVIVTDDESDWSQSFFEAKLALLPAPGIPASYTLHAICSEETLISIPPIPPFPAPCFGGLGIGGAAGIGQTYIDTTTDTGGVWRSICTADWDPIFMAVAEAVSVGIPLPCTYDIPPPPEGETLDPNGVNFVYTPTGGSPTTIPRVDNAAACGAGDGWYYDDPADPTQIIVCANTCTTLGGDADGHVDIQFGCATIVL